MDTVLLIVTAVIIFLQILQIIVLVEILLAWTPILFGRAIRIEAISSIVEPLAE
ncbi:MAG TPA: hypothetical protein PK765_07290 [bacterium]|nr:hypothetical protein [bacterium]